ncbi:hypothetical protein TSOC_002004 [Tetrabaena socialis]|uniref:Uncharacterized protein n=1 Tax=Tetrabaena socialis TaxID=47790 RepID=A0A2J8AF92_9CHLO|nr:hypothetical protein TSOC_002004 [Tetrabaena socialis]|eukprot:PNH11188.1 hypothetical protein TSOC_002004 [Tetrabaena socialis]
MAIVYAARSYLGPCPGRRRLRTRLPNQGVAIQAGADMRQTIAVTETTAAEWPPLLACGPDVTAPARKNDMSRAALAPGAAVVHS